MKHIRNLFVVTVLIGLMASSAVASRRHVAPDVFLDEAEAVVAGEMASVDAQAGTGVIVVSEVLKGDEGIEQARVRFDPEPAPETLPLVQGIISFREGEEGIWVLLRANRDEEGFYRLDHPSLCYSTRDAPELRERLAELAKKRYWYSSGAVAASVFVEDVPPPLDRRPVVYFAVKNVGDKPLRVCDSREAGVFEASLYGPRGEERTLDLCQYLRKHEPPVQKDFPELAPGEVRYIGFRYGVRLRDLPAPGSYVLTVTYSNQDDAKEPGLSNVWTGAVAATVRFTYGLEVGLKPTKPVFEPLQALSFDVTLTNILDESFRLYDCEGYANGRTWNWNFAGGSELITERLHGFARRRLCTAWSACASATASSEPQSLTLAAGQSRTFRAALGERFVFSSVMSVEASALPFPETRKHLRPGKYKLTVWIRLTEPADESTNSGAPPFWIGPITAGPIDVEIRPRVSGERAQQAAFEAFTTSFPAWKQYHRQDLFGDVVREVELDADGRFWNVRLVADNGVVPLSAVIKVDAKTGETVRTERQAEKPDTD